MRENRTYGLEGGEVILPDPYRYNDPHFVTQELQKQITRRRIYVTEIK